MTRPFDVTGFLDTVSGVLNKAAADPFEQIFERLIVAFADHYTGFAQLPFIDYIDDERHRQSMTFMHNSLRQRLKDLITLNQCGQIFERAQQLDRHALDGACAIMIEHFFEDAIFSQADMDADCYDVLLQREIEPNSDLGQNMMQAGRSVYRECRALRYRAITGNIFGFPVDNAEKQDYQAQAYRLLENIMDNAYERYYPEGFDPSY